ncbi:uncharacterized protein LOC122128941 [Clupea harengus]|uniref:Uncharacterized protein LOC122128941 n=1 Tax=Clupea harengus TaxID=7950 RepID=A0A8M1KBS3_CLUHA|nr:uncharacterized protein LOC122128941 [Clupea harengus]
MDHLLLFTLLFSGLGSVSSHMPRRFHFVNQNETWDEAQKHCRTEFTDLATVENMSDMTTMTNGTDEGRNTRERYTLKPPKKNWKNAQKYCRSKAMDLASVRNQTENDKISQIAEKVTNEPVWIGLFKGWTWSDQTNSVFTFWRTDKLALIRENKTWMEAVDYCERRDMELVSATDEDTQSWAREVARGASTAHVWMGLYYICPLDVWFWISGVMVGCNHWAAGNGTGTGECCRAGALQAGGGQKWVSRPETERLNFICRVF